MKSEKKVLVVGEVSQLIEIPNRDSVRLSLADLAEMQKIYQNLCSPQVESFKTIQQSFKPKSLSDYADYLARLARGLKTFKDYEKQLDDIFVSPTKMDLKDNAESQTLAVRKVIETEQKDKLQRLKNITRYIF